MYLVSGTQAESGSDNQIVVSKISSLCETKYDDDPTEEPDDDSDPVISVSTIPHRGAVNRIRVLPVRSLSRSASPTGRRSWACGRRRAW